MQRLRSSATPGVIVSYIRRATRSWSGGRYRSDSTLVNTPSSRDEGCPNNAPSNGFTPRKRPFIMSIVSPKALHVSRLTIVRPQRIISLGSAPSLSSDHSHHRSAVPSRTVIGQATEAITEHMENVGAIRSRCLAIYALTLSPLCRRPQSSVVTYQALIRQHLPLLIALGRAYSIRGMYNCSIHFRNGYKARI